MEENSTKRPANGMVLFAGDVWFDPIEAGIRDRVRGVQIVSVLVVEIR